MCVYLHTVKFISMQKHLNSYVDSTTPMQVKKNPLISLGINKLEPSLGLSVVENLLLGLLLTLTGTP